MKNRRKKKTAFGKRAEMLVLPTAAPINAHSWVDNSMPERDWSLYDSRADVRMGKPVKVEFLPPAFLRKQAA